MHRHVQVTVNYAQSNPNPKVNASTGIPGLDVVSWANWCFPGGANLSRDVFQALVSEAAVANSNDLKEADAIRWAEGYAFPKALLLNDESCLRSAMLDFTVMVKRRQTSMSEWRLNPSRAGRLRDDNPAKALMMELCEGMKVHLPENFIPNGLTDFSALRPSYLSVAPAVNKMLGALVEQGLAILLSYEAAIRYVPRLHFSKAHWTPKRGKPSGRPLGDLTFVEGTPLNTPETAAALTMGRSSTLQSIRLRP